MITTEKQAEIVLAGGRIRCPRCQALSRRSQLQCKKPALRGKHVCGFHGGNSTGPKTAAGKQRMVDAKTVHGRETRTIRAQRSSDVAYLRQLEDVGRVFHVVGGTRTPGPKPASYRPLRTIKTTQRYAHLAPQTLLDASNVATHTVGSLMGVMRNRVIDMPLVAVG